MLRGEPLMPLGPRHDCSMVVDGVAQAAMPHAVSNRSTRLGSIMMSRASEGVPSALR
jgi:hypothetical protein